MMDGSEGRDLVVSLDVVSASAVTAWSPTASAASPGRSQRGEPIMATGRQGGAMPANDGEWGYWVWPENLDRLRGEASRLGLEHCVTTTRSDMASTIWFHEESDARVFQEIMTTDDGPIGRQVVCPRPWLLPEEDWLLHGYEDPAPMPFRRRIMGDREDALEPSSPGQKAGERKIVEGVTPSSAWIDPDNPPIPLGAKLEPFRPHLLRRMSACKAKRAAANHVSRDGEQE
jgi:hypothetical protein